jgi:hypothetical protein
MLEETALCHVPVGTVFQLDGAPPRFVCRVGFFLDREFPELWMGKVVPFLASSFSIFDSFGYFSSGGL